MLLRADRRERGRTGSGAGEGQAFPDLRDQGGLPVEAVLLEHGLDGCAGTGSGAQLVVRDDRRGTRERVRRRSAHGETHPTHDQGIGRSARPLDG